MAGLKKIQRLSRDQIVAYIEAVLFQGYTKKDAYLSHVNKDISNVHQAISALEKREDFQEVYRVLNSDGNLEVREAALRMKKKYANLIEKNIDKATDVLDEAETIKEKAAAVRLVNETVGALAPITNPGSAGVGDQPTKLKRGSVIVE